jgi:hypothetical protein
MERINPQNIFIPNGNHFLKKEFLLMSFAWKCKEKRLWKILGGKINCFFLLAAFVI